MSMHRPKRATSRKADEGKNRDALGGSGAKLPKWEDAVGAQPDERFAAYDAGARWVLGALVAHTKFGKGVVVEVEPGKASILFADGVKKLVQAG